MLWLIYITLHRDKSRLPYKRKYYTIPSKGYIIHVLAPLTNYLHRWTLDTKGYWSGRQIITKFDCPDSKFFPPINLKSCNKTPLVNGRLPIYEETKNGAS